MTRQILTITGITGYISGWNNCSGKKNSTRNYAIIYTTAEEPEERHSTVKRIYDQVKVSFKTYDLKFRHPFTISRGTKTHQPTFVVSLEHFGRQGMGEAPAISYYNIPVEKMA